MRKFMAWHRSLRQLPAALLLLGSFAGTPAALASGETVPLSAVSVPPGATMTITFEVDVDSPLNFCATAVSNQGSISGTNFLSFLTDDPDVGGASNPTVTLLDAVDLAITKTDGVATEVPGTSVTYTIVASNAGPAGALGATVADTFPAAITGVTWTCAGAGGGTCTAAGSGNISDLVNLPAGGSVTYTATGTIQPGATGTLSNTATVTKAASQLECNFANNSATDTDTLTPQVDLSITKTDFQTSINAGSATSYTIVVSNSGPSDAVGATVADTFPAALTGASWTCSASLGSSCAAGPTAGNINDSVTVLAGGSLTYTVGATVSGTFSGALSNTATVTAPGGTTDTNGGNNSATDTTTVNPVADLSITKTDGVTTAVPGQSVTYTITASNAGPATATGATVADTFPATLTCTWTCVGAGGGTCSAAGSGNINDSVNLPAGGSVTYTASCTISAAATGSLANTATISGGGVSDTVPGNNSATDTDTLNPQTDVSITKTDGSTTEVPGTPVTYTIVASNAGPSVATGVTVADTFPGILSGCSWTSVAAGGATGNTAGPVAGNISNSGITLPSGASVTYTATCNVAANATGSLANTATITAATTDPTSGNNSATDTDTLTPQTDLSVTKTDGAVSEVPGTPVTYTIVASNAGPSTATGVSVSDTFPGILSGCSWTSVAAGGATGNAAGPVSGNIAESGMTFPVTASVTYTATCDIAANATGSLANTATVASATTDPTPGNNSATDTDTLTAQFDLAITKTDGQTSINAGSATTYTIVVSNSGPSTATAATVADTFPADLLSPTWTCVASPGSSCTAGPVAGNLNDTATVAAAGNVTYTVNATVNGTASGTLSNTATVTLAGDPNGGNNSATDTTTVNPVADLSITKTDGATTAVPGMTVTYTIVAANAGPATATAASVTDTFPAACASVNWTCVPTGVGASCTAGPVAGNIADGATLPAGTSATYTAVCTLADTASGSLVNTASIGGGSVSDTNPANDSASDTDTILPLDYGDAPGSAQGSPWAYPTLVADNGARHGVNGPGALHMGALLDTEADGQPTLAADGDDQVSVPNVDDEDGVTLPATLDACGTANVAVNASAVAKLDAFVDWNRNGSFADAGEKIFDNQALAAGANVLPFNVPCTATPTTFTFARFRLSTVGGLASDGVAADGEVEDYTVGVRGLDFGDAPAAYPTLLAGNGARHIVVPGSLQLGALVDTEADGQPTGGANGDDLATSDDEDGVAFTSPLIRGQNASVTVTASAPGVLNAWLDFNGDSNWTTTGDAIFVNLALAAGANNLTFPVPATATTNLNTVARFRFATVGGLSFTGLANDGEVEDHAIATAAEADVAITKTDSVATEVPGTTVTYTIVASNNGPDTASGVTVADTFPGTLSGCSTTSVAAGGATGNDAGPVAGNLSDSGIDLPVGGTVTYTATCTIAASATGSLANTATITSATGDPVSGNNSATDTDTLTPQTDLAVTKTDGAATEVPGTPVTYTIVVTNAGPSDAVAANVADTFPAIVSGVSWTCVGASGGICPANGSGNLNASVTLPAAGGATVTFTATGNISAAATGTLSNTATVAAGAGATDPVAGNNSATDTDTLNVESDLAITKTDGAASEVPGTPVTYTITASNAGPSNNLGATVADTFPAIVSGVTWTCSGAGGGTCPAAGAGDLNASVNLPSGGSVTFTATGNIASSATGSLANTATVGAAGGTTDPNLANNSATDTDTLEPSADIQIVKDDSADPPPAGDDLIYTLTVTNLGPSDATGVAVSDPLPAEVTYVSDDCGGTNTPPWGWTIGNLAAGASEVCNITVSINPAPPTSISNTASVASTTPDPASGNDSDTEITTLDAVPPQVTIVNSVADTGDGSLAECETANVTISSLRLTFDEAMQNPPGDTDPDDVTNPANYLVVSAGADFDFATTACGGAAGDDIALAVASVAYDNGTDTATLALAAALPAAQIRLFACDALTDLAGNALDGDADTTAGGDFRRAFRSDPGNVFANGHFDCDGDLWNAVAATPAEVSWTGAEDADDADDSGAMHFTNLAPGSDTSFRLWQCYDIPADQLFDVSVRVRLAAAPGEFIGFVRRCEFFNSPGCLGSLGSQTAALALQDTAGAWLTVGAQLARPVGAVAARCDFSFETPTAESFDGWLDATRFAGTGGLFSDGFESGDTSAWSAAVP
jgi:uncharacterized repeat protein (TIGR01451 family)